MTGRINLVGPPEMLQRNCGTSLKSTEAHRDKMPWSQCVFLLKSETSLHGNDHPDISGDCLGMLSSFQDSYGHGCTRQCYDSHFQGHMQQSCGQAIEAEKSYSSNAIGCTQSRCHPQVVLESLRFCCIPFHPWHVLTGVRTQHCYNPSLWKQLLNCGSEVELHGENLLIRTPCITCLGKC